MGVLQSYDFADLSLMFHIQIVVFLKRQEEIMKIPPVHLVKFMRLGKCIDPVPRDNERNLFPQRF